MPVNSDHKEVKRLIRRLNQAGVQNKFVRKLVLPTLKTTMVKLVYCITKRADLSHDEFFGYWKDVHGPIGARIPGVRKMVQNHRIVVPGDKYRPTYDGMVELWF